MNWESNQKHSKQKKKNKRIINKYLNEKHHGTKRKSEISQW